LTLNTYFRGYIVDRLGSQPPHAPPVHEPEERGCCCYVVHRRGWGVRSPFQARPQPYTLNPKTYILIALLPHSKP